MPGSQNFPSKNITPNIDLLQFFNTFFNHLCHRQVPFKMSVYASTYPTSTPFDPAYKQFFEDFYAVSDTPDAHEKYVDQYTQDAVLIMASKKVQGRDGTSVSD